ncbi:hypothetical protein M501DRAFT_985021 [Patellaria atrata CBS 101060]|uniref:SET domain-containing protein n=1 Tax=Patellaria atrata CBS 101060 TaxID=1346257 RepID=A0A9P4SHY0_9PEZI|nr:hypothetical protein M501DRAFT_985021 [Patellaria atrata CBS 101060]
MDRPNRHVSFEEAHNDETAKPSTGDFSLKVVCRMRSISVAIARANDHLSNLRVVEALKIYTDVLYWKSPGHPAAFLNRSLCYLLLDYPSLAVIDGYRALLGARWTKQQGIRMAQYEQIYAMSNATKEWRSTRTQAWAFEPGCFIDRGKEGKLPWLAGDLCSLTIQPDPREGRKKELTHVINDVLLKAHYRIALGLWKCGGGALKSALNVIGSAKDFPWCTEEDMEEFTALENMILNHIDKYLKADDNARRIALQQGELKQDAIDVFDNLGIRGLLRTRATKIPRELYPWDQRSLSKIGLAIEISTTKAEILQDTLGYRAVDLAQGDQACKLAFQTVRAVPANILVFSDRNYFAAAAGDTNSFCDNCGAFLHPERTGIDLASRVAKKVLDSGGVSSRVRRKIEKIRAMKAQAGALPVPSDGKGRNKESITPEWDTTSDIEPEGFQVCPTCTKAWFCGKPCYEQAMAMYHKHICKCGMEERIEFKIGQYEWDGVPSSAEQRVQSVLMLKVLSRSKGSTGEEGHPLDQPWIKQLDGQLNNARYLDYTDHPRPLPDYDCPPFEAIFPDQFDPTKRSARYRSLAHKTDPVSDAYISSSTNPQTLSSASSHATASNRNTPDMQLWSYDKNVLIPIQSLLDVGGPQMALDALRFDGWVLNTLAAKLESAAIVTSHPRFGKLYDEENEQFGQLVLGPDHDGPDTWVATLNPRAHLVPIAKEGEEVNVKLVERDNMLRCVTVRNIKKGEVLRRADSVTFASEKGDTVLGQEFLWWGYDEWVDDTDSEMDMGEEYEYEYEEEYGSEGEYEGEGEYEPDTEEDILRRNEIMESVEKEVEMQEAGDAGDELSDPEDYTAGD